MSRKPKENNIEINTEIPTEISTPTITEAISAIENNRKDYNDSPKCCGAYKEELINTLPMVIYRNRYGLLEDKDIKYIYNEQGLIDYRAMIPKEFLVVNKQAFKNKPIPDSIDGL